MTRTIRSEIRNQIRNNPEIPISLEFLAEDLTRMMAISYALGFERFGVDRQAIRLDLLSAIESVVDRIAGISLPTLRRRFLDRARSALQDAADYMNTLVRAFVREQRNRGVSVRPGSRELGDLFNRIGIGDKSPHRIEAIFRTESMIAYNNGKWTAEQDPAIADILWGYLYSTVGDDRVRPEHAQFEGVTLPKEHPFWLSFYPPNGWVCRCSAVPFLEEVDIVLPPDNALPIDPEFIGTPDLLVINFF